MTDLRKAAEMALEALEMFCEHGAILRPLETKEALRQALAQPVDAVNISAERVDETAKREQEPYGYLWFTHQMERRFTHYRPKQEQRIGEVTPIYTAPSKREWVGLTVNEARKFYEKYTDREELIYAIDEFLEEKNSG